MIYSSRQTALPTVMACIGILFVVSGCQQPKSPSFETEQIFTLPLIGDTRYELLGSRRALIDSTSASFSDLFNTDPATGMVSLSFDSAFPFGNFERVLPVVDTSPLDTESALSILFPDISGENEADFTTITGFPADAFPAGTTLPAGSSGPVILTVEPDNFLLAEGAEGAITLKLSNDLGFSLSNVRIFVSSQSGGIGNELNTGFLQSGENRLIPYPLNGSTNITGPLQLLLNFSWPQQVMSSSAASLNIQLQAGSLAVTNRAVGAFEPLSLQHSYTIEVETDQFSFIEPDDFVFVDKATFFFTDVVNELDLDFDSLIFSFPTIFRTDSNGKFTPADTLFFSKSGDDRIRRSSHPSNIPGVSFSFIAENLHVLSDDGSLPFTIFGITEDTRASGAEAVRDVKAAETLNLRLESLRIVASAAKGFIAPRFVTVGDSDGDVLDLRNSEHRNRSALDDFLFITRRVKNVDLVNTSMQLIYETDLGIETRPYIAMLARTEDGEEKLLSALPGSPFSVASGDSISGLQLDGSELNTDNIITFVTDRSDGLKQTTGQVVLNSSNTNLDNFLTILPSEILFITRALANPLETGGFVEQPVTFDALARITVPFSFATRNGPATFTDTLSVSLASLPDPRDDVYISEASISVRYQNRLPLDLDVRLNFLDSVSDEVTIVPLPEEDGIRVLSAPVDESGFSTGVRSEMVTLVLDESQLGQLNQSRTLILNGEFLTRDFQPVSLRGNDYLDLDVRATFTLRTRVE
ncbi:MAG: hypothetical protein LAT67_13310 [Balneolales bacterium]|nr:hypothetical protein [Balneolales bacterium]